MAGVLVSIATLGWDSPKQYDDGMTEDPLEGTWRATKTEVGGQTINLSTYEVKTFHNGIYTIKWDDGDLWQGKYQIDTTCKPPRLDWMPSGGHYKGQMFKCIFRIDGNTLKIAGSNYDDERPKGFSGDGIYVHSYRRVRK
jgi:uncharacterized protein (TIGR03067 family)